MCSRSPIAAAAERLDRAGGWVRELEILLTRPCIFPRPPIGRALSTTTTPCPLLHSLPPHTPSSSSLFEGLLRPFLVPSMASEATDGTSPSSISQPRLPAASRAQQQEDLKTVYTWTTFFNILTGQANGPQTQAYFLARDLANEEADCKRCDADKAYLFQRSPMIRFMREQIQELGGDISPDVVRCRRCTGFMAGGYSRDHGILLCANVMRDRGHIEDVLSHEMVHAYDDLRFKWDPSSLRHAACAEIRASMLSGECRWVREALGKWQWNFTGQFQECVRRRAGISMRGRVMGAKYPELASGGTTWDQLAEKVRKDIVSESNKAVNEVWESCFKDTRPFDEIYR